MPKSITISGTVSDYVTRNPVGSADISTNVLGTSYKATTDNTGRYSLNISFNRKPPLIILVASKKNYLPSVKLISNIQPGRTYTANFTMRDITPPSKPVVTDDGEYLIASNALHADWSSEDKESGIKQYRYSVGTRAGSMDIIRWTSTGVNTEITLSSLNLNHGRTYYFNVRAINGVNLPSAVGSSDGITVNAHVPEITRIIPYSDTVMTVGDEATIEATAQDLDNDPVQYQFSIDGQVKQPFSSLNTYNYTVEPSTSNTHILKVEVRDDKNGSVSQEVTYNIQNVVIDTTPPPAPTLTTNSQSSSLDSIEAQWLSEDPESGIIEYQYAIGTTSGGTDVVYWSTYGNNTQAYLSGLNLEKGSQYYLSVVAKNGAGLKSAISTSPAITAQKEPYIKIYYPYQNAVITDRETKVKGVAEGLTQITINGKVVSVNEDGSFEGPTLVAPGYAKRFNIVDDNDHIVMNFPKETTITAQCAGQEDTVSFYYAQLLLKGNYEEQDTNTNIINNSTWTYSCVYEEWNYDSLVIPPFGGWEDASKNERITVTYSNFPERNLIGYGEISQLPPYQCVFDKFHAIYYDQNEDGAYVVYRERNIMHKCNWFVQTPPAVMGELKPLILVFNDCNFLELTVTDDPPPFNLESYKVNGIPLRKLYGNLKRLTTSDRNACYVVITDYEPDSELGLNIEVPYYPDRLMQPGDLQDKKQQYFEFAKINILSLDAVREIPYGSGNYVPVKTIPIFQPDDGKEKGISVENTGPRLVLKLDEDLLNSRIDYIEAKFKHNDQTVTYNLTETSADSGVFNDPSGSVTLKLAPLPETASNYQDELTCIVTSTQYGLSEEVISFKESASDSLYFSEPNVFVSLKFSQEPLPYIVDTLIMSYATEGATFEESLTETTPDSLVFVRNDNSLNVKIMVYEGILPDKLVAHIQGNGALEMRDMTVSVDKVDSNSYSNKKWVVYDKKPAIPSNTGEGMFRIEVKGLGMLPQDILAALPINIGTGLQTASLNLTEQPDGSCMTEGVLLNREEEAIQYDGINCLKSSDEGVFEYKIGNFDDIKNSQKTVDSAFAGQFWIDDVRQSAQYANRVLRDELGYFTLPSEVSGVHEALSRQQLFDRLPKCSIWFSFSHGNPLGDDAHPDGIEGCFYGFWVRDERNGSKCLVLPDDISSNIKGNGYDLVFLDSCHSAGLEPGSNTDAFTNAFKAKAYVGWSKKISAGTGQWVAQDFFRQCANNNPVIARNNVNIKGDYIMGVPGYRGSIPPGSELQCLGSEPTVNINLNTKD
ncbi:MAG: hypothetical protein WC486_00495 [Candidatus Omnitrophota bacterium]